MMKNKKALIATAGVLAIAAIGGTFAYFRFTESFNNRFKLGGDNVKFTETFESPDDWTPCTETPKQLVVDNSSQTALNARVKYSERWEKVTRNNDSTVTVGDPLPLVVNNQRMAVINFAHPEDWVYNNTDGYYYYNKDIAPGSSSTSFIESVTFNCDANNDYNSAQYHLVLDVEVVQATPEARRNEGWNWNF